MMWLVVVVPVIYLAYVVFDWQRRNQLFKKIDSHPCCLCGTMMDEALFDFLGRINKHEKQQLDNFQKQYAYCKIRCGNCGGILLCADNGMPMRGYFEGEP